MSNNTFIHLSISIFDILLMYIPLMCFLHGLMRKRLCEVNFMLNGPGIHHYIKEFSISIILLGKKHRYYRLAFLKALYQRHNDIFLSFLSRAYKLRILLPNENIHCAFEID